MSYTPSNVLFKISDLNVSTFGGRDPSLPAVSYKLVGRDSTDALTNKILVSSTNDVAANKILTTGGAVTISGTAPSTGQVLTATSSTSANWQTPSGGSVSATSVTYTPSGTNWINTPDNVGEALDELARLLGLNLTVGFETDVPGGTDQDTAYLLNKATTHFTNTSLSTGNSVKLPKASTANVGRRMLVINDSTNTILVYPFDGTDDVGMGAGFSVQVSAGTSAMYVCLSATRWLKVLS